MENNIENNGTLYHPKAALMVYENEQMGNGCYVEYFDIDEDGCPVNAHPLSVREAQKLSRALDTAEQAERAFLKPQGIIPTDVLHVNPAEGGKVVWYTKAQERKLFFTDALEIPSGVTMVPPMVWVATKDMLWVYAVMTKRRPLENSPLCHAPFFNVYREGNVCMGTVDVRIKQSASLEEFTTAWENYFFNSYFSHLMGYNPVKGNLVLIWKKLIDADEVFPLDELIQTGKKLKDLLR